MSDALLRKLRQAYERLQRGEIPQAALLCEDVLRRAPVNVDALWLLGSARLLENRPGEAAAVLERAVACDGRHGPALEQLGLARLMLGEYKAAEAVLRTAVGVPGAPPSVRMRLGVSLLHQDKNAEAIAELRRVLADDPASLDARLNLGQAYAREGDLIAAARELDAALSAAPAHADALYNRGVVRTKLGAFRDAAADLRKLIALDQPNAAILNALSDACFQCGEMDEAYAAAQRARELEPAHPDAYNMLAQVYQVRGDFDAAARMLEEGYARSGAGNLLGGLVHVLHRLCEWERWRAAWRQMADKLPDADDLGSPFWLLHEETSAREQLAYTRRWAANRFGAYAGVRRRPSSGRGERERVRVGYFSADFHQHATSALLVRVLELHDLERFEVFAYSYGPDDRSEMRTRVQNAVEHFVDVVHLSNDRVAARMREDRLDILVDLKGYTLGERLDVMAARPCAMQMTWLGYPGTAGNDFIDYVIADPFVIPPQAEPDFSERVLRLPHGYQPTDRNRCVAPPLTRAEYGLPGDAFVFCCFNQTVKITPEVFACWMRLLKAVPDSVLWLLHDNPRATENLLAAARADEIDAKRVVIAPRLPMERHVARYGVADLALDTHPYTSHTTASDSLWMGCPLVALCGTTFAGRVSGSILASANVPDLIAYSMPEYEQLAQQLALDRKKLAAMRARVLAARDNAPLFDSALFARDLEQLYLHALEPAQPEKHGAA